MSEIRIVSTAIMVLTVVSLYISLSLQLQPFIHEEAGSFGLIDKKSVHLTVEELTRNPPAGSISCPEPLLPMYDRIVDTSSSAGGISPSPRKIPRTIHASMQSRCLSPDFYNTLQSWKDALPHHSFYFHDDNAVDRLFDMPWDEFPQLGSYMRCVRFKGAMRIDVWRILVIYRYGGLYTDIDQYPSEMFTEAAPIKANDEAFFLSDVWNRPSQWFFGMEPNHPIAYYTMYEIFLRLQKLEAIERPNVVFVTGPDAVKHGYGLASLGWTVADSGDIFLEGTHRCKWNKTVTKLGKQQGYVDQLNMKEMVDWNATIKVTRRERINRHHGMTHWLDEKNSKKIEFDGTCMDYLYSLDHGLNKSSAGKWK